MVVLFLILATTFIANGNQFDLVSANISLIGTLLIIALLYKFTKDRDLNCLELGKRSFKILVGYLILFYVVAFLYLLPERLPGTITPYISVIAFYAISIVFILRSTKKKEELQILRTNSYSTRNIISLIPLLILAVNVACIVPAISLAVLSITYLMLSIIGVLLFLQVIYNIWKHDKSGNAIDL